MNFNLENLLTSFKPKVKLPNPTDYPEGMTVSYPNVFKDYTYALNQSGLGLGFIETHADHYILFVYHLKDKDGYMISTALSKAGLNSSSYNEDWDE